MAQPPKPGSNGNGAPREGIGQGQVEIRVLNQYIKDLSFEHPNVGKQMVVQGESPNLQVEVNVNAQRLQHLVDIYESAIVLKATCSSKAGKLYEFECEYGGLFEVKHMPDQALEQFLLVNCPALLFPFLRRIAADITREGGFPPLLLDPIDFAALYLQRRQQQQAGQPATA